jgi:hypothetical protein
VYVETWFGAVSKPAIILDIDETSLSNWPAIAADDFGIIADGKCDGLPKGPCGWRAWQLSAKAPALATTLELFKAATSNGIAVFFITGRNGDIDMRTATEKKKARQTKLRPQPQVDHFNLEVLGKGIVRIDIFWSILPPREGVALLCRRIIVAGAP